MTTKALRAWVDESGSDHTRDPGTYVLAAAISRPPTEATIRDQLQRLRLPAQIKLHWRDEDPTRRSAITHTVAACDIDHVVIVRVGADQERPERRRRKCLERLLHELEARSILDVVLESRGRADDRRDIQMLNALRGQHYLSTSIRLTHVVGRYEPMLWIPDAVCGAVTSARIGDPSHQSILNQQLTLIEIAGPQ